MADIRDSADFASLLKGGLEQALRQHIEADVVQDFEEKLSAMHEQALSAFRKTVRDILAQYTFTEIHSLREVLEMRDRILVEVSFNDEDGVRCDSSD